MRRDILWKGNPKVVVKTDNEPGIEVVLSEVLKGLKVEVVQAAADHPPPYDSKASGSVENAVRQVQGMVRTIKD